jgi:hypothetical protein
VLVAARILSLVGVLALGALAAGCGGKSAAPRVATGSTRGASPALYSRCMRAHGVARFPDLTAGFADEEVTAPARIDTHTPQFRSAQRACANRLPGGGPVQTAADLAAERQAVAQALRFSVCMRAHGLPSFPDPAPAGAGGGIRLPAGLNRRSPHFQAAQNACASFDGKAPKKGAR